MMLDEHGDPSPHDTAAPWWSTTIWQIGPLALGFLFMLGVFVGLIPSPLVEIREKVGALYEIRTENHRLLRAICRNTSTDPWQKAECDRGDR